MIIVVLNNPEVEHELHTCTLQAKEHTAPLFVVISKCLQIELLAKWK